MSRLKFSSNLFLEVNELQRFYKFIENDGWKRAIKAIVKNFGIVENASNSYFKVTEKLGSNSVVIINSGLAFDSNLDAIVMEDNLELSIANTGQNRWIILSRGIKNTEKGTVNINSDGSLSGINTEFTKVLRGQPNFPVKIKFNSSKNIEEYEVVSVNSDNSALISGSLVNENGVEYSVIGTFTPGFQPSDENKMIYEYDSYTISIVDSSDKPSISTNEFILAMVSYNESGAMIISDERINYMFNNPYIQGNASSIGIDPLVSLLNVNVVGGINSEGSVSAEIELILEHGYSVKQYKLQTTSTSNTFIIVEGQCNFLSNGNIPDSMFKGWLLVNRANMKYVIIDDNTNKSLFISNFDSSILEGDTDDFIVIPNFLNIEYEIRVSGNVDLPSIPFYFKNSLFNLFTRSRIYAFFPGQNIENFSDEITIYIKYRLLDNSGKQYPFENLSIAQFDNINGQKETLAESSFTINLSEIKPQEKQRNYS